MHRDYRENYPSAATELSPVCFTVVHVSRGGFSRPVGFFHPLFGDCIVVPLRINFDYPFGSTSGPVSAQIIQIL